MSAERSVDYAVEIAFEAEFEERVRQLWGELAEAGVSCLMPEMGARPHISLATFHGIDPQQLRDTVEIIVATTVPLPIKFSSVGAFPGNEGVVFLAAVVTPELLALHADFHSRLSDTGLAAHPYYRPGEWVPHCTTALEVPRERLYDAVRMTRQSGVFGGTRLTEIGLIGFDPLRVLYSYPLSGQP